MVKKVISQIRFEIGQIDHLFAVYADLLAQAQQTEPTTVEITAIASSSIHFITGWKISFSQL